MAKMRMLALAYRALALLGDPEGCAALDRIVEQLGETWVAPHRPHHDPDDLINRDQAARILCIKPNSVTQLAKRERLRVYRPTTDRRPRYRAGDVYELASRIRSRNGK
jgi:hypothetical protein